MTDRADLFASMRAAAELRVKRGNGCAYCDGHGNVRILQAGIVQGSLSCEWCDGDQYADLGDAEDKIALHDALLAAEATVATQAARITELEAETIVIDEGAASCSKAAHNLWRTTVLYYEDMYDRLASENEALRAELAKVQSS